MKGTHIGIPKASQEEFVEIPTGITREIHRGILKDVRERILGRIFKGIQKEILEEPGDKFLLKLREESLKGSHDDPRQES